MAPRDLRALRLSGGLKSHREAYQNCGARRITAANYETSTVQGLPARLNAVSTLWRQGAITLMFDNSLASIARRVAALAMLVS